MKTKCKLKWYYAIMVGFCSIIDGLVTIFTLGNYTFNLGLKLAYYASRKRWIKLT